MDSDSEDNYMATAERVAKQDYLREEIVEGGYDTALFVEYCEGLRGTDVDLWQFDELKGCVEAFKTQYQRLQADRSTVVNVHKPANIRQSLILTDIPEDFIQDDPLETETPSTATKLAEGPRSSSPGVTGTSLAESSQANQEPSVPESQSKKYVVLCKQLHPTDLSRSANAQVEVSQ